MTWEAIMILIVVSHFATHFTKQIKMTGTEW